MEKMFFLGGITVGESVHAKPAKGKRKGREGKPFAPFALRSLPSPYSSFRHSTGLMRAALRAWEPTVRKAISRASSPAAMKYQASRSMR